MNRFPWRSLLYVPAHEARFVAKAADRGADAIVLDLEDGVPDAAKDDARNALARAVPSAGRDGTDVFVRIDGRWRRAWRDLEAAVAAGARGVVVPKVRDAGALRVIAAYLDELEHDMGRPAGAVGLIAQLEDAAGVLAARDVAACRRMLALVPGNLDLALDLGVDPGAEVFVATHARLLLAARAAGIALVGTLGGGTEFGDLDSFGATVTRARAFGFDAVTCIHPAQLAVVHAAFAPDPAELAAAERVVAAYDAAGGGAVAVDGRMVDRPVAERARALLRRAGRPTGGAVADPAAEFASDERGPA